MSNCSGAAGGGRFVSLVPLLLVLALAAGAARAAPWAEPGDMRLRHDLQLLADAGIVRAPLSSWPLSWGDLARDLLAADAADGLDSATAAALGRTRRAARAAMRTGAPRRSLRLSAAESPRRLRAFENTPRETAEASAAVEWTGLRLAYRLELTLVGDPDDDRDLRLDGSYAGVALGNYMLSAGAVDRWWGPGWEGSLILSNNARPVPAITLERNYAEPFDSRWLRWIGPWRLSVIWGQLEGDRDVPNARLFGARFTFRPLTGLEVGISRTAQWCGAGRPCDAGTFADLLLGRDNRGAELAVEDEPGNQLAGVDFRWAPRWSAVPLALYGQFVAEDEAGGTPSRYIGQLGVESWGELDGRWLRGSYRFFLEAADTASEFYSDKPRFDFAYEHFIYEDGYRYRGRAIGHGLDNDGRLQAAGFLLIDAHERSWSLTLRHADLNRGGARINNNSVARRPKDLLDIELTNVRTLGAGRLELGLGVERLDDEATGNDSRDIRAYVQWLQDF